MGEPAEILFLFDVDNTLIDNDSIQHDLRDHLLQTYGAKTCERYWALFEELRGELGYADYLGALERYRLEDLHAPQILHMATWLVDYPFARQLYPGALDVVRHVRRWGPTVILSDGDAVFQPRKVERSGLWAAFEERVLIYVHKEEELDDVEHWYPAKHYVLTDDKLRILDAIKRRWRERVTTVFANQGHYAREVKRTDYLPADIEIERIADLANYDLSRLARG
jgi:hypothetical protein